MRQDQLKYILEQAVLIAILISRTQRLRITKCPGWRNGPQRFSERNDWRTSWVQIV